MSLNLYGPTETARNFFAESPQALREGAFFLLGSAILLWIYTATMVSRLRLLGDREPGSDIASGGGLAASGGLLIHPVLFVLTPIHLFSTI
jgi:hypothetical protein